MSHLAKVAAATQKKQQHKMQTVIRLSGHSRFHLVPYTVGIMCNENHLQNLKAFWLICDIEASFALN